MGDYYQPRGGRSTSGYRGGRSGGYDNSGNSGYDDGGYRGGRSSRGRGRGDYYEPQQAGGYDVGGRYQGQGGRGGYQGGGFHDDNSYNNSWQGGGRSSGRSSGGRRGGRYSGNFGGGRGGGRQDDGNRRRQEREPEMETLCPDVAPAVEMQAHSKKLSSIGVDSAAAATAAQVYTASHDGTVKFWNTSQADPVHTLDVGGPADSLLLSGGFLFVGVQKLDEGIIKVWNLATAAHHQLPGHRGQILCMHAAGGLLFSGGQDRSIRVWSFNAQANIFMSQSIITKEEGGHEASVLAFQSHGSFLFSADSAGRIKVWNLASGQLAQTIEKAHQEAITQMLLWESFLLTASADGFIKTWEIMESPVPNMVIKPEASFAFSKDAEEGGDRGGGREGSRGGRSNPHQYRRPTTSAIFAMTGTLDHAGSPVLLVCFHGEPHVA